MSRHRFTGPFMVALGIGLLLVALVPQAVLGTGFAARAAINPRSQFVGDAAGSTFTLKVKNTGTVKTINAVRITRPTSYWSLLSCDTPRPGWATVQTADSCTYVNNGGAPIATRHTATFSLLVATDMANGNRAGTWNVQVSNGPDFSNPSWIKQAGAMSPGLKTNAYSFEITDAVVATSAATVGDPCPVSGKAADEGSTAVVVVCGINHTNTTQVTRAAYSTLSGTLLAAPGTFSGGSVAASSSAVVLGNWSDATIVANSGTGKTVKARIGAFAHVNSPLTTMTGYSADYVNLPPTAADDTSYSTNEDNALQVNAPGVLGNDSDADSDPLTAILVAGPSHAQSFTLNPDGSFDYTPNADYNGTDSFTYKANDATHDSNVATVQISVTAVNDAPVAVDDNGASYTTNEDTSLTLPAPGFLSNDYDPDGGSVSMLYVNGDGSWQALPPASTAQGGQLYPNVNGAFTYNPPADFHGTDSFTYNLWDGTALSNTATVTFTVVSVNDAPVAVNDSFAVTYGSPAVFDAAHGLATDVTDADGDALTYEIVSGPTGAAPVVGWSFDTATGAFTYAPSASTTGDSFTWRAFDGTAYSNTVTMTITINTGGGGGGGGGGCLKVC